MAANTRRRSEATAPLGPPIDARMEDVAILRWRSSYRRYRLGEGQGAKGESPTKKKGRPRRRQQQQGVHSDEEGDSRAGDMPPPAEQAEAPSLMGDEPEEPPLLPTAAPLGPPIDARMEDLAVLKWRTSYRRYRLGEDHGAKGEFSSALRGADGDRPADE